MRGGKCFCRRDDVDINHRHLCERRRFSAERRSDNLSLNADAFGKARHAIGGERGCNFAFRRVRLESPSSTSKLVPRPVYARRPIFLSAAARNRSICLSSLISICAIISPSPIIITRFEKALASAACERDGEEMARD